MEITVKEAAKRLGLHPSRIRQLITEGKLPANRHGKRLLLINESDIELIKLPSLYSKSTRTLKNKDKSDSDKELLNTIQLQNLKIQNLEEELLKLKLKISSVEQIYIALQQSQILHPSQPAKLLNQEITQPLQPLISAQSINKQRLEWLKANQENYAGKYLGFDQEKLVSVASTYKEAKEHAIKAGVTNPFIVHMPDPKVVYHINW